MHAQEAIGWHERDTLTGDWGGARTGWEDAGVTFNAGYAAEVAGNLSGGDKRTARYTQQLELETLLDMARLAGIDDARVQITLNHRTGHSLSADVLHNQFSVQQLYTSAQILRLSQLNWLQHFDDDRLDRATGLVAAGQRPGPPGQLLQVPERGHLRPRERDDHQQRRDQRSGLVYCLIVD